MTTKLNNEAAIVEPWMTELWAWADEFKIGELCLLRNLNDLNAITELFIRSDNLIKPNENVVQIPIHLNNLKNLKTLRIHFHNENEIPESLLKINCDIELEFYSKQKKLPVSLLTKLASLKSLTGLTINNDGLTELPDSVFKLNDLRKLIINCNYIKQISETIGQMTGLNGLTLNCENLKRLPESLAQLTHLDWLHIPSQLINQLPLNIIEKYRNKEIGLLGLPSALPITRLYKPLTEDYSISEFGFFLSHDNWDEQLLLSLKYKSGAHFLFALQTSDKHIEKLDVIDGIIICEPEEVQQVMAVSATVLRGRYSRLPIDYGDVKRTLQFTKSAHFIQASALGGNKLERAEIAVVQLLGQIPKNTIVKSIVINIKSDCILWLDEIDIINTAVYTAFTDEADIWFNNEKIDKPKCCWIEAIYMVE